MASEDEVPQLVEDLDSPTEALKQSGSAGGIKKEKEEE